MNVMDILKSYVERPTDTQQDFDEVAQQVPADALAGGLSDSFRSDRTPEFGQMVASLFQGSNSQQRSGLLQQLAGALGPSVLSSIAGGLFGRLGSGMGASADSAAVDAGAVTADQVNEIATAAQKQDPSVLDRVGAFYAQHPEVIKAIGGGALAILLGQMATRMKR